MAHHEKVKKETIAGDMYVELDSDADGIFIRFFRFGFKDFMYGNVNRTETMPLDAGQLGTALEGKTIDLLAAMHYLFYAEAGGGYVPSEISRFASVIPKHAQRDLVDSMMNFPREELQKVYRVSFSYFNVNEDAGTFDVEVIIAKKLEG